VTDSVIGSSYRGLRITRVRLGLINAIEEDGRIYFEAGDARDGLTGWVVTAQMKTLIRAGIARAADPAEPRRPKELSFRRYYRLVDEAARALRVVQKGQN
jgi:hypothetical protein